MRWCALILTLLVARTWLPPMTDGFWLDETLTSFILRHGLDHPSLDAAPGSRDTVYYPLLAAWKAVFGASEWSLRVPSLLLSLAALYFLWRIAARLIHPCAAWIAVFLCFITREYTLRAIEARPYALALALAAAGMWCLIRYCDEPSRWRHAVLFVLCASLLVWTHMLLAPFLAVYLVYAMQRRMPWGPLLAMAAIILAVTAPVIASAIGLAPAHRSHIFADLPTAREIAVAMQVPILAGLGVVAWVVGRRSRETVATESSSGFVFLVWWLWQPALLAGISYATGSSIFVRRYFITAILGAALLGGWLAARFLPKHRLGPAAWTVGGAILILNLVRPANSFYSPLREVSALATQWASGTNALVLCPSMFVEAQPPVWSPEYPTPGFLYSHLDHYPVPGERLLLPTVDAAKHPYDTVKSYLDGTRPVLIFGGAAAVSMWENYLVELPQVRGWAHTRRQMGDITVVRFAPP